MPRERWERIKSLYLDALEVDSKDRKSDHFSEQLAAQNSYLINC